LARSTGFRGLPVTGSDWIVLQVGVDLKIETKSGKNEIYMAVAS